ncbi:MAG: 4-(cytidine 5'-diphospho)-2-C-methyl-D-erythritol kinase [Planctomycetota bacterium]
MNCKAQFEEAQGRLLVRAPGKINLSLLIAGKRPDGFHQIDTIMAKINLYDELIFQRSQKQGIKLHCTGSYWAPPGPDNLVFKAVQLACRIAQKRPQIKITLKKNMPAGSGLGSASSDAVAALLAINRFDNLQLSRESILAAATQLGSDTAFFLSGPLARCTGRGENVQRMEQKFNFSALLILPNITVSTKRAYEEYRHDPDYFRTVEKKIIKLIEKNRIDLIAQICANMLQQSCFHLHEELVQLRRDIENLGISPLCLSGSGAAMFYMLRGDDLKNAKNYQIILDRKIACKSVIVSNNRW